MTARNRDPGAGARTRRPVEAVVLDMDGVLIEGEMEPTAISSETVARVAARYAEGLPLVDGAVEVVRELAGRWPLGLASSANRPIIELVLDRSGLTSCFRTTVSSEEVARGKPAPDVYLEAAARLGVPAERCAAVEAANGLRSAAAAGMWVVAVPNRRYPPPAELVQAADLVLTDLRDLKPAAMPSTSSPSPEPDRPVSAVEAPAQGVPRSREADQALALPRVAGAVEHGRSCSGGRWAAQRFRHRRAGLPGADDRHHDPSAAGMAAAAPRARLARRRPHDAGCIHKLLLGVLKDVRTPWPRCMSNPWVRQLHASVGLPEDYRGAAGALLTALGVDLEELRGAVSAELRQPVS